MAEGRYFSISLSENARTRPILDGSVRVPGARLLPTPLHPSEMFWRQLRYGDFDISEMSISSLLIAAARGDKDWVGVPVFTMRRFFHTGILVRAGAGIDRPADLHGRRVGVPEYQQTAAIWGRGVLQHEFGVAPSDIQWFMERGSDKSHGHATGFTPPPGVSVTPIASTTNIGEMLASGELDATLLYLNEPNLVDRSRRKLDGDDRVRPLFPDPLGEGRRYFQKVGFMPINHLLVIRRETYEQNPWLALNLYSAFLEAKAAAERTAKDVLAPYAATGLAPADPVGLQDPMPYGFKANQPVLETIARYVHEQGLTPERVDIAELFAPSVRDL
jgi:4,5-dihydroxyphthalate decarboxylase